MMDMDRLIEQLYEEMYSPKIHPEELINNALLPNYETVIFEANEAGLLVITKCLLESGKEAEFKYQFNENKCLLRLACKTEGQNKILYDRKQEIENKHSVLKRILECKVQAV